VTAWQCDRELKSSTTYFWRVRSVRGDAHGSWIEAHFTTAAGGSAPLAAAGQVINMPGQTSPVDDSTAWVLFALAVVLMVALITFVMRTAARG
jgi:hypothetical protein